MRERPHYGTCPGLRPHVPAGAPQESILSFLLSFFPRWRTPRKYSFFLSPLAHPKKVLFLSFPAGAPQKSTLSFFPRWRTPLADTLLTVPQVHPGPEGDGQGPVSSVPHPGDGHVAPAALQQSTASLGGALVLAC